MGDPGKVLETLGAHLISAADEAGLRRLDGIIGSLRQLTDHELGGSQPAGRTSPQPAGRKPVSKPVSKPAAEVPPSKPPPSPRAKTMIADKPPPSPRPGAHSRPPAAEPITCGYRTETVI